ncbi:MAG: site-specific integrase [Mariprofundus sp.]|nr:site-specific integrase [Mariprofundus sp.]
MAIEVKKKDGKVIGYRAKPYWKGKALAGYSKTFPTKAKAKAHIESVLTKVREGNLVDRRKSESITLHQALEDYWLEVARYQKSSESIMYRINVLKANPLASLPLSAVKTSDILNLQNKLLETKAPSTVISDLSPAGKAIDHAKVRHDMPYLVNPCDAVKAPAIGDNSRTRRLSQAERKVLLHGCHKSGNKYLLEVVLLAIELGLRRSKLVGLKWKQVNFKSKVVLYDGELVSNKGVPPVAPFTKRMERIFLRMHKRTGNGEYVFPTTTNAIKLAFDKVKRTSNIEDFRFHDLRHEAISRMFDEGLEIVHIMLFTGIKSAQTLRRYIQPKEEAMVALRYK